MPSSLRSKLRSKEVLFLGRRSGEKGWTVVVGRKVVENCKSRNSGRHGWWRRFALPALMCAQPISGGIGTLSLRQTFYSLSPLFPNTYFCLEAVFGVAETAGLEEKAELFEAHCCSTANIFGKVL
jgi:hypothetical protein